MSKYFVSVFILILIIKEIFNNKKIEILSQRLEPMNWNDIVQDEDFIIKALHKLQVDLDITTVTNADSTLDTTVSETITIPKEKSRNLIEILINGTAEELQKVSRRKIVKLLPILDKIEVNLQKKLILWNIFKDNKNISALSSNEIKQFEPMFLIIPEHELYIMNVTDLEVLYYLGSLSIMTRRKAAILAYALKNRLNLKSKDLLQVNMINSMMGIICGFPVYELSKLNASVVLSIKKEVFNNLWACTDDQLDILLQLCKSNFQFAHVEMWDEDIIKKLGFVLKSLEPSEMNLMKPELFAQIPIHVFQRLSKTQLMALNKDHVKFFNKEQLNIYNAKTIN